MAEKIEVSGNRTSRTPSLAAHTIFEMGLAPQQVQFPSFLSTTERQQVSHPPLTLQVGVQVFSQTWGQTQPRETAEDAGIEPTQPCGLICFPSKPLTIRMSSLGSGEGENRTRSAFWALSVFKADS